MLATFNRSDTLLGICEALGQDVGFDPTWLRVALAVGLLWSPAVMIAVYLGLGAVVAIARAATPARPPAATTPARPVAAANDAAVEWQQAA